MTRPFSRRGEAVRVSLSNRERSLIAGIPRLLGSVAPDEPAAARLDPPAYPEDPDASATFHDLVAGDLERARREDRSRFAATVSSDELTDDEAEAWMRVIGEARIVVGSRLGIDEDGWEGDGRLARSPEAAMLHYLGYLQDGLATVLADRL